MGNVKNPKTPLSRPHTKPYLNKFKTNGPAGGGRGPKPPFKKPHGKGGGGTFAKSKGAQKQVNSIPFYSLTSFLIDPEIFPGKSSKISRTSGGQSPEAERAGRTTCQSQRREGGKNTTV